MRALLLALVVGLTGCDVPTGNEDNPILSFSPTELDFGTEKQSLGLIVENEGSGSLHWELSIPTADAEWIESEQVVGDITTQASSFSITIKRDRATTIGDRKVFLRIVTPVGTGICTLLAVIERQASIAVTPTTIDFGEGSTTDQITLRNTGGADLEWSALSGQSWMALTPPNGTIPPSGAQNIVVVVDREDQPAGDLIGQVDVTSTGGSAQVTVRATVSAVAVLGITPRTLDFGSVQDRLNIELRVAGANADWTIEASDSWLQPTRTSGAVLLGQAVPLSVDVDRTQLAVGTHQGTLTLRSSGDEIAVDVTVTVQPKPVLELSVNRVDLGLESATVVRIANVGTGSLEWELTEAVDWLQLDQTRGTSTNLAIPVTFTVDREGLLAGDYTSTLSVTSDGGNLDVEVRMEVPLPAVRIISGPVDDEVVLDDSTTFEIVAQQAYGEVQYQARIDEGTWNDWSAERRFGFGALEESSLFGPHTLEVRTRTAAGDGAVESRSFLVDAVQGPAIHIAPMRIQTSPGEDVMVSVVLEEVTGVLGGNVVLTFDPVIDVSDALLVEDLLDGATTISPSITIKTGRVEVGFAVAGLPGGVSGTGALLRLTLSASVSSAIEISSESILRDLANQDIPIRVRDGRILVE